MYNMYYVTTGPIISSPTDLGIMDKYVGGQKIIRTIFFSIESEQDKIYEKE